MKWLLLGAALVGCGFHPGATAGGGGGDGGGGAEGTTSSEGGCVPWSYTPANFDPCALPPPGTLDGGVSGLVIDTDNPGTSALTTTQADGVKLVVIHLSALDLSGSWIAQGEGALVLAVDGPVTIQQNAMLAVSADADDTAVCSTWTGMAGHTSSAAGAGGGGGAGGAGGAAGGKGGDGADGPAAAAHGAGGVTTPAGGPDQLSPLHGGCAGGDGGQTNNTGTPGVGGLGGGAIQISSNTSVEIDGMIDAAGHGASGAAQAETGAGGGGGGGAIFLEGPHVKLDANAVLCADGGGGGGGGGSSTAGTAGGDSPCDGMKGGDAGNLGNNGGAGGDGGSAKTVAGEAAQNAKGNPGGGGGGGGGGVGWIRLHQVTGGPMVDPKAIVTPMQE